MALTMVAINGVHNSPVEIKLNCPLQGSFHFYLQCIVNRLDFTDTLIENKRLFGIAMNEQQEISGSLPITVIRNYWAYASDGDFWRINSMYTPYGPRVNTRDILGVHLNLISGTMEFHINSVPLGIIVRNLDINQTYYPMINNSNISIIKMERIPDSLQVRAFRSLLTVSPYNEILDNSPPGLIQTINNLECFNYCRGQEANPNRFRREMVIVSSDSDDDSNIIKRKRQRRVNRSPDRDNDSSEDASMGGKFFLNLN